MKVGFIGLGNVGSKLAKNLINNNFSLKHKLKIGLKKDYTLTTEKIWKLSFTLFQWFLS